MENVNTSRLGFTLIELLVVVLIIGILAAVALPQYKMAVAKGRLIPLMATAKSVKAAEETYYLANNQYTSDWDNIAINVPGEKALGLNRRMNFDNGYISLEEVGVSVVSHQVEGVKIYFFYDNGTFAYKGKISCYAKMGNDWAKKVCLNLTGQTHYAGTNGPDTDYIYHFE